MPKLTRSVLALFVLLLAALPWSVLADGPVDGRAGRAELRFLEGMMDHHQMALDMAADCLGKATNPDVRALCQTITDTQSAEITQMQTWALAWYNVAYTPVPMADMGAMDMGGMDITTEAAMPGMDMGTTDGPYTDPTMMMGMFAGLNRLEGAEYEVAWLESMIDHHDDALHMAERLLTRVPEGEGHAELRALAEAIIATQSAEMEQMEALLTSYAP